MKERDQIIGACAFAAVLVFSVGLFAEWWHVECGPSPTSRSALTGPSASATPAPLGERLADGRRRIAWVTFSAHATALADLYVEEGISAGDVQAIATTIDADVVDVQRTYGRRFGARPVVFVLSDTAAYTSGIRSALGTETPAPATLEATGVALTGGVVVNWEKVAREQPVTTFRHELTHLMIRQIAKPTKANPVPAWINEGSARIEEFTIPGTGWAQLWHRYAAASMVAAGRHFAVAALRSQDDWGARTGAAATGAMYEAAGVVRLLRDDVGIAGVIQILDLMGQGQTFDAAFLAVAGTTAEAFANSAPSRVEALSARYPYVATLPGHPGPADLGYILYGFAPNSVVDFDIVGRTTGVKNTTGHGTVDEFGLLGSHLGTEWPPDTYSITVSGPTPAGTTISVSVSATKIAAAPAR